MRLFVLALGFMALANTSELRAEDSCVLVRRLASSLGCGSLGSGSDGVISKPNDDFVVSENFTSDTCLTAKPLDEFKVAQKAECKKWLDEKRKELGKQYLTGNCVQNCNPCDTATLLKCSTTGSIHYRAAK